MTLPKVIFGPFIPHDLTWGPFWPPDFRWPYLRSLLAPWILDNLIEVNFGLRILDDHTLGHFWPLHSAWPYLRPLLAPVFRMTLPEITFGPRIPYDLGRQLVCHGEAGGCFTCLHIVLVIKQYLKKKNISDNDLVRKSHSENNSMEKLKLH